MNEKKYEFAACSCGNFVYIFGGRNSKEGDCLSTCEKYNLVEDKWTQLPNMPHDRAQAKAVLTPDEKRIIIVGGTSFLQTVNEIDM